jgi:hypothetical protein
MCHEILDCCEVLNIFTVEYCSIVPCYLFGWGWNIFDKVQIVLVPEGPVFSVGFINVLLLAN